MESIFMQHVGADHVGKVIAWTLLPLFWLSSPAAFAASSHKTDALACHIKVSDRPDGLHIEAVAEAERPVAGRYKLVVVKASESGSSQNLQNGEFQLENGKEQILAQLILDRSAIGHYKAALSLKWDDGNESCSAP